MSISVGCPCGKRLKINDHLAGKHVKCPGCGEPLAVPAGVSAERTRPKTRPPVDDRPRKKRPTAPARLSGPVLGALIGGAALVLLVGVAIGILLLRRSPTAPETTLAANAPDQKVVATNNPPPPDKTPIKKTEANDPPRSDPVGKPKTESKAPEPKADPPEPEPKADPKAEPKTDPRTPDEKGVETPPAKKDPSAGGDLPRTGPGDPKLTYDDVKKQPDLHRGKRVNWPALAVAGESGASVNRVLCAVNHADVKDMRQYRMVAIDMKGDILDLMIKGPTRVTGTIAGAVTITYDVSGPGGAGKEKRIESVPLLVFATFGNDVPAANPPPKDPVRQPAVNPAEREKDLLTALRLFGNLDGVRIYKLNLDPKAGMAPEKIIQATNTAEAALFQDRGNLEKRFPIFARMLKDMPAAKSFHVAVKNVVALANLETVLGPPDRRTEQPVTVSIPGPGSARVTWHFYGWCGFGVTADNMIVALTADLELMRGNKTAAAPVPATDPPPAMPAAGADGLSIKLVRSGPASIDHADFVGKQFAGVVMEITSGRDKARAILSAASLRAIDRKGKRVPAAVLVIVRGRESLEPTAKLLAGSAAKGRDVVIGGGAVEPGPLGRRQLGVSEAKITNPTTGQVNPPADTTVLQVGDLMLSLPLHLASGGGAEFGFRRDQPVEFGILFPTDADAIASVEILGRTLPFGPSPK